MMGKMCGTIKSIVGLLGGVSLLAGGLGYMNWMAADLWAGVFFTLFGLAMVMHTMMDCPMCKTDSKMMK